MFYYWAKNTKSTQLAVWGGTGLVLNGIRLLSHVLTRSSRMLFITNYSSKLFVKRNCLCNKIWTQFFKLFNLSLFGPLWSNNLFLPSKLNSACALSKSVLSETYFWMEHWFTSKVWMTNITFCKKFFPLSSSSQFIKDIITFPHLPLEGLSSFLEKPENPKGLTLKLCAHILGFEHSPLPKIEQEWENELGVQFQDHCWEKVKLHVNHSSCCSRLNLIHFKVLHRIHLKKAQWALDFPGTSEACNRCSAASSLLTLSAHN